MESGVLGRKIQTVYRENDEATFQAFLGTILGSYRDTFMSEIETVMPHMDGKFRLKVMEVLINDGGKDLIPFFIRWIRREKNVLYAKSMVLVYGNFEHQEALGALLELETDLAADVKQAFVRVTSKMKAKHREVFYMTEFESGVTKRVKFAANTMIKEPHPSYIPFLNDYILRKGIKSETDAVLVLTEIGDLSSLNAMFQLLTKIGAQMNRLTGFRTFLQNHGDQKYQLDAICPELAYAMETNLAELESQAKLAAGGNSEPFINTVISGLHFHSALIQPDAEHFFKQIVLGTPITASDVRKLNLALDMYSDHHYNILHETLVAMGRIAERTDAPDLIPRIDQIIPEGPRKQHLMISVLMGFRTPESLKMLLDYAENSTDSTLLKKVVEALGHFKMDALPEAIRKLALEADNSELGHAATQLIGQWGFGQEIMKPLLNHKALVAKVEGVRLVAEFKIQEGYDALLALLQANIPDSMVIEVIKALRSFPDERTGDALNPLLSQGGSYNVRSTALEVLFESGGSQRMALLVEDIQNAGRRQDEMLASFLDLMYKGRPEDWQDQFYDHMDFWFELLEHENPKFREKLLIIMNSLSWEREDLEDQLHRFSKLSHSHKVKRQKVEEDKLQDLIALINRQQQAKFRYNRVHKILNEILEKYEHEDHYSKVQAMRRLGMAYKPTMLEDNPEGRDALLKMVNHFLDTNAGAEDLVTLAVTVIGKIDEPELKSRITQYATHANPALAQAARHALHMDEVKTGKIHTVFVIDDSRYITKQLSTVLDKAGYEVQAENHALAALECLKMKRFDLLILDLNMPEMDGSDFLQKARAENTAPPHILVIASTRNREELAGIVRQGIEGLLIKPFPMGDLLGKISVME